jgi:hypothetical protein
MEDLDKQQAYHIRPKIPDNRFNANRMYNPFSIKPLEKLNLPAPGNAGP